MGINEQVKELRNLSFALWVDTPTSAMAKTALNKAADTIEALSAKLAAANMERSDRYYGGGWISCDKDNLPDEEVLCCDKYGEMILGYITEDGESETGFCAENDNEYMYNCVKWMEKPKP